MPIYEYQCEKCGARTELLQRVGASPVGSCEACGGELKRLLSAPAIQFKGKGWYVTDYARKGASGNGAGSTSSGPKTESGKSSEASSSDSGSSKGDSSGSPTSGKDSTKSSAKSGGAKESSGAGS